MTPWSISDAIWSLLPVSWAGRVADPADQDIESDTRRQAATDFTRALMENFDQQVTEIINGYITSFLQVFTKDTSCDHRLMRCVQDYSSNPAGKWKSKDTAIYLLTSIASRGSTQQVS